MVQSSSNGSSAQTNDGKGSAPRHSRTVQHTSLVKQIYKQEYPEQYIKTLPAQSLYLALKQSGIESCGDIVDMATVQQCKLMLDFDLWSKDRFCEDNIWEWLALPDQDECELDILHKILRSVDLKLISLLIAKYVQVEVFEESTDQPPGEKFYTPDKGSTWINIAIEDTHKHFLLGRLLAFLFDNDAQVFYQLIAIPGLSTLSLLEEEAFQDRGRRLESEGVPNAEESAECNTPVSHQVILDLLNSATAAEESVLQTDIEPSRGIVRTPEPLAQVILQLANYEEFEIQLSHLMNSAIVHFGIDHSEVSDVQSLIESVKGAINIGLEHTLLSAPEISALEVYSRVGLKNLYRVGIRELFKLRSAAQKAQLSTDTEVFSNHLVEGLRLAIPVMPIFMEDDGSVRQEGESVSAERKAISHMQTCKLLLDLLSKLKTDD